MRKAQAIAAGRVKQIAPPKSSFRLLSCLELFSVINARVSAKSRVSK